MARHFPTMIMKFIYSLPFLFFYFSQASESSEKLLVFDSVINPVLEARCQHCHGASKDKGKFRLDSKTNLLLGGRGAGEDIIVKGDPEASELIYRITLPKEDEEAMPPLEDDSDYHPVTQNELKILETWIKLGASFDLLVSELDENTQLLARNLLKNLPKRIPSATEQAIPKLPQVPKASEEAIAEISKMGVLVMPIAQNTNALYLNASYLGDRFNNDMLESILPIADQLMWLNLARTNVSDEAGIYLARFKKLTRLHLENSQVSDGIAESLEKLKDLEYLNLYGTNISDSSIPNLKKLSKLRKIFLWQTKVTKNGAKELKKSFGDQNLFEKLSNQYSELKTRISNISITENENIKKLEDQVSKASSQTKDRVAVNQKCPVSQKDIDQKVSSIFEGRKIGLCCTKCKAKYDKEMSSYRAKIDNFSPSSEFTSASSKLVAAQKAIEMKIADVNSDLKKVSFQLNAIGPEINLGWETSK